MPGHSALGKQAHDPFISLAATSVHFIEFLEPLGSAQEALRERGLAARGTKEELAERLWEAYLLESGVSRHDDDDDEHTDEARRQRGGGSYAGSQRGRQVLSAYFSFHLHPCQLPFCHGPCRITGAAMTWMTWPAGWRGFTHGTAPAR